MTNPGLDPVSAAKQRIREVTPQQVLERVERGDEVVLVDVREPREWNLGRLPGAIHIPLGDVEAGIEARVPRDADVVIYCARGNRSALAADTLQNLGYTTVASMSGGINEWAGLGGPIDG